MTRQLAPGAVVWTLAVLSIAFSAGTSGAADLKIGFIDSERIFAEYAGTKEAQEAFNREVQDLSKTAREKKSVIDELQRKLDDQAPMLSEAKRDLQNQELQKKIAEYEAFVQTNWGPGGEVNRLNERYLKPIVDRVHRIVSAIGTDEGYSIIFDAADGNIVFGDKALDLTDRVLSGLTQEDSGVVPSTTRPGTPPPPGSGQ